MEVFWRKGYDGTSIEDIEVATGVKRGSLYNAFGGKDELFLLALERYDQRVEQPLLASLEEEDISSALLTLLDTQLQSIADKASPKGCLFASSMGEASCLEGRVGTSLRQRLQASEDTVHTRLTRAQEEGQLRPEADTRALARYILAIIRVTPLIERAMKNAEIARDVAATALNSALALTTES